MITIIQIKEFMLHALFGSLSTASDLFLTCYDKLYLHNQVVVECNCSRT